MPEADPTPERKLAGARRSYAAFSAGPDVEALLPLYDPECEWHFGAMGAAFGTESVRGHDGLRAWATELGEVFADFTVEIDEARITDDGVLLVRGHSSGRSRDSAAEVSLPRLWQEIEFRGDLAFRIVQHDGPPPGWADATPIRA